MDAYDLYCYCRKIRGWNKPLKETFENSKEKGFFELLEKYFTEQIKLKDKDIKNYIICIYNINPDAFDPYTLPLEESKTHYYEWKNKYSTKEKYKNEIINGIIFIENFCLKNKLKLNDYVYKYSKKHIREERFDWSIPVCCKFIDNSKLSRVEKMLLKKYINQYIIIEHRLNNNKDLVELITNRMSEVDKVTKKYH